MTVQSGRFQGCSPPCRCVHSETVPLKSETERDDFTLFVMIASKYIFIRSLQVNNGSSTWSIQRQLELLILLRAVSGYGPNILEEGIPWRSSGQGSGLRLQGARVRSLMGGLKSHMPRGQKKKTTFFFGGNSCQLSFMLLKQDIPEGTSNLRAALKLLLTEPAGVFF